jgi:hypothetical protein
MKRLIATFTAISILSQPTLVSAAQASNWYPTGYSTVPKLTSDVAYKVVPAGQGGNCVWCSTRHGNYYWKVDFITKVDCSNLYINTTIKNLKGNVIGAWYQKGFYTPKMKPKRLEVVTPYKEATFEITTISC